MNALLHITIILPLLVLVSHFNKNTIIILVKFVLVYLICSFLVSYLLNTSLFDAQQYNWCGKGSALLFLLIIINIPVLGLNQFRFGLDFKLEEGKKLLLFCALYFVFRLLIYIAIPGASFQFHLETFLYQATLPGFQEEILLRGILLTLIHQSVRTHGIYLGNLPISWAALITSLLFGLEHGLEVDVNNLLNFSWFSFIRTFMDGFIFARLTERTKSLMPAIIYHNLLNLIGNH
jgi:uncharacterized protein